MLYVPEAQGSLPRGGHCCTYGVRVPALGAPYVTRTVVTPGEKGSYLTSTGALSVYSGAKTGRPPKDKRIVEEEARWTVP